MRVYFERMKDNSRGVANEIKGVSSMELGVQRAGIMTFLDVELGTARFHFLTCQRVWSWASTPISAAISILSCVVAASEALALREPPSDQSERGGGGGERCSSGHSARFARGGVRWGVSFALAALSTMFTIIRPYTQRSVAREAVRRINQIGGAFDQLCAQECSESNIHAMEQLQRDLQAVRAEFSSPFMCVGVQCGNLYLRLFPYDVLLTRWRVTHRHAHALDEHL